MEMSPKDQSEDLQVSEDDITTDFKKKEKEPDSERRIRYAKQILMFLAASIGQMNSGMAQAWPNSLASDLVTDNTTLFGGEMMLYDWEMDMISSILFAGTLPGLLFGGWLAGKHGRRKAMMSSALPGAIGWGMQFFAVNSIMMLLGRFICGVAFGIIGVSTRSYLAEIADTPIRGVAGLASDVMKGVGAIIIIALGILVPWYYLCLICGCYILIFGFLIVPFLPESPTHLLVKGNEEKSHKVLRRLRGPYADLEEEVIQLKEKNERKDGGTGFTVLFKPDVVRKILVITGIFVIANFCGAEVIRANALRMLQTSGLTLDSDISMILVFTLYLGGIVSQASLTDRIGRKKCLIISLALLVIAYTTLGTYVFLDSPAVEVVPLNPAGNVTSSADTISSSEGNKWNWIPTVCIMVAAFSTSLGIGPVPWMLAAEYFPTNIRSQMMSVCAIIGGVVAFVGLQCYSPLQDALTPAGLYWSYACVAFIGIIYTITLITETKGKKVG